MIYEHFQHFPPLEVQSNHCYHFKAEDLTNARLEPPSASQPLVDQALATQTTRVLPSTHWRRVKMTAFLAYDI